MGLQPSELYAMELGEFLTAYNGYGYREQLRQRFDLERTRLGAGAIILPWLDGDHRPTLQELMPFEWDGVAETATDTELNFEARQRRARALLGDYE